MGKTGRDAYLIEKYASFPRNTEPLLTLTRSLIFLCKETHMHSCLGQSTWHLTEIQVTFSLCCTAVSFTCFLSPPLSIILVTFIYCRLKSIEVVLISNQISALSSRGTPEDH